MLADALIVKVVQTDRFYAFHGSTNLMPLDQWLGSHAAGAKWPPLQVVGATWEHQMQRNKWGNPNLTMTPLCSFSLLCRTQHNSSIIPLPLNLQGTQTSETSGCLFPVLGPGYSPACFVRPELGL